MRGSDEISVLAVSINDMLESLGRSAEALKDSETKYRSLVENINIGVFRLSSDPEGGFLQANPALGRILGFDSARELVDLPFNEFFLNKRDADRFYQDLARDGFIKNRELRLQKRDGTPIWGSCAASIMPERAGRIPWIDGVLEDITERNRPRMRLSGTATGWKSLWRNAPPN